MREESKPRRRPISRFDDRAKRVLAMAGSEATRLHRDIVDPEHVLLGLLTCGGIPAKVLEDSGVKLEEARRAVEAMTGHGDRSKFRRLRRRPAPGKLSNSRLTKRIALETRTSARSTYFLRWCGSPGAPRPSSIRSGCPAI